MIAKIVTYCFDKWWRPLLFFAFVAGCLIINGELHIREFRRPLSFLSDASLIILLVSFVYQVYKKRFLKGFLTIFIVFATLIISMMLTMIDGDHWADDLEIPTGIQIENPINTDGYSPPGSIVHLKRTQTDLVLYNYGQPGNYKYDFWTRRIEKGTIYLKVFEITNDEELSSDNVETDSEADVYNPTDSLIRFNSTRSFTIYEGDWGKHYAARFEVWWKPLPAGKERKIFEKNFKIEGWMH